MNTPNQQVPGRDGKTYCCFLKNGVGCEQPPKWEIYSEPRTYDNYTHSCSDHVEDLKSADSDLVVPLEWPTKKLVYEVAESRHVPDVWHVEAINYAGDGEIYGATFSGPGSKARAEEYATWKNKR